MYGVLVCGEPVLLSPSPSRNARNGRTATSRARHIETSHHHMSKFWVREQSFGRSDFLLGHVVTSNSAFGSARVDLARFKRIKFRRVLLIRSSRHEPSIYPISLGPKTLVSPSRHEPAPTCLRNGDPVASANSEHERSAPDRPRGDHRLCICPAGYLRGLPSSLLPQGETRATMMFRIAVIEKRKKRKAAPSCSSDRCPDPLIRRRTFPTPRPGAPMSPFARSTNTRPAAPRIPLRSEYPVTSNPRRLGLKSTHA